MARSKITGDVQMISDVLCGSYTVMSFRISVTFEQPRKAWWVSESRNFVEYVMSERLSGSSLGMGTVCGFQVSQWYDLIVFTASMEIYGTAVAEKLDQNRGILKRRYYRQVGSGLLFDACTFHSGNCLVTCGIQHAVFNMFTRELSSSLTY